MTRGPNDKPPSAASGRRSISAAQAEHRLADAELVARPQSEPGRRGRFHDGAEHAVILSRHGVASGLVGFSGERNRAVKRIGGIDRPQLDQAAPPAVERARHRAQSRGLGQRAAARQKRALGGAGRTQRQPRADIAAQQEPRIGAQPGLDRGPQRADRGDRADPEHEAGEKHAKPAARRAIRARRKAVPICMGCRVTDGRQCAAQPVSRYG